MGTGNVFFDMAFSRVVQSESDTCPVVRPDPTLVRGVCLASVLYNGIRRRFWRPTTEVVGCRACEKNDD
jgi:hypothetical protein